MEKNQANGKQWEAIAAGHKKFYFILLLSSRKPTGVFFSVLYPDRAS
jgi:hypothetical protein